MFRVIHRVRNVDEPNPDYENEKHKKTNKIKAPVNVGDSKEVGADSRT